MNIKPKYPKYLRCLGTTKHPPHTNQHKKNHSCTKKHTCNNNNKTSPTPMVIILGHSPHLPTCVWVGWVFIYFSCFCCMNCFHCRSCLHCTSCFHCHFHCSFDRCLHPPHPIHPVVAQPVPISPSRCVQCCSHCLHGVK